MNIFSFLLFSCSPVYFIAKRSDIVCCVFVYAKHLAPRIVNIARNQVVILVSDLRYVALQILNVVVERSIDTKTVRTIRIVEILDMCCSISKRNCSSDTYCSDRSYMLHCT